MLGLLVNLGAIVIGTLIGVPARKHISKDLSESVLTAIGLCVLYIGITGLFTGANSIVILLAFAIGTFIGAGIDLDGKLERAGKRLEKKLVKGDSEGSLVGPGLTFFLISCTGAYTITACFEAGLGDYRMLYIKAILDLVVSLTMAAGMGIGVMLSIIPMLIYQGLLILCSSVLSQFLTESMISAMSCAGALITVVIGTNMIGATKLKAVNYLPAIVMAPVLQYLADLTGII